MAKKTQRILVSPPAPQDAQSLKDYTSVVQQNFEELFEGAHDHPVRTSAPSENDGSVGDILLVEDASSTKLYVKFRSGWKSISLS